MMTRTQGNTFRSLKKIARETVRFFRYAGRTYHCALCGRRARIFTPVTEYPGQATIDRYRIVAMGTNPHYRCPWCNSSDKERLVWRYLVTKTDVLTTARTVRVLHIAPERNTRKKLQSRPNIRYVHGDKFFGASKYTPEHYGGAAYLDITDLSQFPDGAFDLIICNHVLEHVPDDRQGMRELYRVLARGGTAILQVPVSRDITDSIEDLHAATDEERIEKFGQADHVRIYAERDYLARLAEAGFAVDAVPCRALFSPQEAEAERWGVNQEESVYATRKG